mgnify:CR=1 FL=1
MIEAYTHEREDSFLYWIVRHDTNGYTLLSWFTSCGKYGDASSFVRNTYKDIQEVLPSHTWERIL